ncbi:MAG: hypothetical protein ACOX5G_10590 [Kiritimatiellia bacterium]|jgi:hypothetical protein
MFFVDVGIANINAGLSGGAQFNSLWLQVSWFHPNRDRDHDRLFNHGIHRTHGKTSTKRKDGLRLTHPDTHTSIGERLHAVQINQGGLK